MHSQGRGRFSVLVKNLPDIDTRTVREAEVVCNTLIGFNFGQRIIFLAVPNGTGMTQLQRASAAKSYVDLFGLRRNTLSPTTFRAPRR
jgi:hypothetical protein